MKALIAGSGGQLGRALRRTAPEGVTVVAPTEAEFDICDASSVVRALATSNADVLINAAAYTAVDKAESDEAAARCVNVDAVATLGAGALAAGMRFVHISTDFVFDGHSTTPYQPSDATAPLSAYGRTKLAGEAAAAGAHGDPLIVRTAWVYAAQGNNFVRTMLRLMKERSEIRVVADQIGSPTHAPGLATAIWSLLAVGETGLFHWTDAGIASWYDFAVAIQEEALTLGLLTEAVPVIPVGTADYPTPARRPTCAVLDKTTTWQVTGRARHWRAELRDMLAAVALDRDAA